MAAKSNRLPLLDQVAVQRIVYPKLVGVLIIAAWQVLVVAYELPPYLVRSPGLVPKTLCTDWPTLGLALWNTVQITLQAFIATAVVGVLISVLFVQSKVIETALFPFAVLLQVTPIVAVATLIII